MEEAARLATQDLWGIVNRGQARMIEQLLNRIESKQISDDRRIEIKLAQGSILGFHGDGEAARSCYMEVLDLETHTIDLSTTIVSQARACLGMGELLEYETPTEAFEWLQRGYEAAERRR